MSLNNKNFRQFVKFGIVGSINTAIDWGLFFILTNFVDTAKSFEPTAKAVSFMITVINSFIWHSKWTFKAEFKQGMGNNQNKIQTGTLIFIKFFIVSIIGWGINFCVFKYTRFNLDQSKLISLVVASGVGIFWNFFVNKLWTYKN